MAKGVAPLEIWLYGTRLALLTQPNPARLRYRLEFTEEALDTYGEGRRILSLALPVSTVPVTDSGGGHLPVTNFLDGLLPEGNLRQQLASAQRVATTDLMALLGAVGGDCAGAVQFLRPGELAPGPRVRELTDDQVAQMVADLPTYNFPDGAMPQASLAGIQDKILLTALPGGRWGLPENGAASTHITGAVCPLSCATAASVWASRTDGAALLVATTICFPPWRKRASTTSPRFPIKARESTSSGAASARAPAPPAAPPPL